MIKIAHSINHTAGLQTPYSHTPVFQAVEPSVIPSLKEVTTETPLLTLSFLLPCTSPTPFPFIPAFIIMTGSEEVCVCFLACRWVAKAIHSHGYNLLWHIRLGFRPVWSCCFLRSEKVISHCFSSICDSIRSCGKLGSDVTATGNRCK